MKIKYKYFKDFSDAVVYFGKVILWYYQTDYETRCVDEVINNEPARSVALYDKNTGEVYSITEFHYSLCNKYVVIIKDYFY